jgi:maltose O-acetyltransferase
VWATVRMVPLWLTDDVVAGAHRLPLVQLSDVIVGGSSRRCLGDKAESDLSLCPATDSSRPSLPTGSPEWYSTISGEGERRMARSEKDRMLAGELYRPGAPEIQFDQAATRAWLARYNASLALSDDERRALLVERFAEVGPGAVVRPPFYCDYGFNIRLGAHVFLNFDCVILDVVEVTIGEGTQIGPAVQIYTADHPRDAAQRRDGVEFGRLVRIGRHVWIGGGAMVLPGVTVGDDAVIGAGSVVTRDVAAGATVVGNPARMIKAEGVQGVSDGFIRRETVPDRER